jgi:hypothetical protein
MFCASAALIGLLVLIVVLVVFAPKPNKQEEEPQYRLSGWVDTQGR